MKPLRINIVLPFITTKPGGGTKVMYEYANRLQQRGHSVTILHSIERPYIKIKSPVWWKQLIYRMRGISGPPWFQLEAGIRSMIVPCITEPFVPDGDIVLCTWWEMTYMISRLPASKGKRFNLIQDYEIWKGHEDLVHQSYSLPVQPLVIAKYLQELVEQRSGISPVHIPNAIDTGKFQLREPIQNRNPQSIIMLYSEEPRKGTAYGIAALKEVQKNLPSISADLFGVYHKPDIPDWIIYHEKPADLPGLMNRNAIFFSPSIGEGWALPPAESMACGCAIVCTAIGGHADYAYDGETALLAETMNVPDMAQKLIRLMEDPDFRIRLALKGHQFITTQFSWDASVSKMETCFYNALL